MTKLTENQLMFFSKSHDSQIKLFELTSGNKDDVSMVGSSITNGDADNNSVDKSSSDDLDSSCSIDLSEWMRKLNIIGTLHQLFFDKYRQLPIIMAYSC